MRNVGVVLRWWERLLGAAESGLGQRTGVCLWCGGRVRDRGRLAVLCARCNAEVPWIDEIVCLTCGRAEECPDCVRRKSSYIAANRAAVKYTPFMKELLARYKYRGSERLAPLFQEMAAYAYGLLPSPAVRTVLTFVPLSERRLEERGFNQAEVMARGVAGYYRLPVLPLLDRTRHTEKQSYKSRRERLESLDRAFALRDDGAASLREMLRTGPVRLVIVDDVYTTGSTMQQCGGVIWRGIGSSSLTIYGLTWAR